MRSRFGGQEHHEAEHSGFPSVVYKPGKDFSFLRTSVLPYVAIVTLFLSPGWASDPDPASKSLRKYSGIRARDFARVVMIFFFFPVITELVICKPGAADSILMKDLRSKPALREAESRDERDL